MLEILAPPSNGAGLDMVEILNCLESVRKGAIERHQADQSKRCAEIRSRSMQSEQARRGKQAYNKSQC